MVTKLPESCPTKKPLAEEQKEMGYLDRGRKVLALGKRLWGRGGSVTPEISQVRS